MNRSLEREVASLGKQSVMQLRTRFAELFSERPRSGNRVWLTRRITWRLQAIREGDLSERARQRAAELANDADLRTKPPRNPLPRPEPRVAEREPVPTKADRRLPPVGTVITRSYKGTLLKVLVRPDGFEFGGAIYRSLSAVAKQITGSHLNGFAFFGLTGGQR